MSPSTLALHGSDTCSTIIGAAFYSLYDGSVVDEYTLRLSGWNSGLSKLEMEVALYHTPTLFLAGGLVVLRI